MYTALLAQTRQRNVA